MDICICDVQDLTTSFIVEARPKEHPCTHVPCKHLLAQGQSMSVALPKCLSLSDLTAQTLNGNGQSGTVRGYRAASFEASAREDREDNQPLKRSRSDQSLTTGVLPSSSSHQLSLSLQFSNSGGGVHPSPFIRSARPALPVVLSDHGSTNSLVSLDSELTRSSASVPGLHALLSAASAGALPRSGTPGAVRMTQASSAVSLTQVQQQAYSWQGVPHTSSATSMEGSLHGATAAAAAKAAAQGCYATSAPTGMGDVVMAPASMSPQQQQQFRSTTGPAAGRAESASSLAPSNSVADSDVLSPSTSGLLLSVPRIFTPPPVISPSPMASNWAPRVGGSISISGAKGLTGPHLSAEDVSSMQQQQLGPGRSSAPAQPATEQQQQQDDGRRSSAGGQASSNGAAATSTGQGGGWLSGRHSLGQLPTAALEMLQRNLLRTAQVVPRPAGPTAGGEGPQPSSSQAGQQQQQASTSSAYISSSSSHHAQAMAPASAAANAAALLGTTPPGGLSSRVRPSLLSPGDGSCPQLSMLQAAGGSAPLPMMQPRMNRVASSENTWAFTSRRSAAVSAPSGAATPGMRRRSSLEVTMPWRAQLEEAIAAAHAGEESHAAVVRAAPSTIDSDSDEEDLSLSLDGAADRLDLTAEGAAAVSRSARSSHEQQPLGSPSGRRSVGDRRSSDRRSSDRRFGANNQQQNLLRAAFGDPGSDTSGSFARRGSTERSSNDSSDLSSRGRGTSQDAADARRGSNVSAGSSQRHASYYNSSSTPGGAALELFVRLNRARQTLDFAKRQSTLFADLNRAEMDVWSGLEMLNGLREYEASIMAGVSPPDEPLDPDLSLRDHAFQVAELCRMTFPDKPWMHLVGLLHGMGKLLAHESFGAQPQWAVAGESYPLGCRFAPQISHHEYFSANPDRRRRLYSTPAGIYQAGCGLKNVYMSWGAPEYLYMMLVLNQVALPEEALFILRFQRCFSLTRPGGAYRQLLSPGDLALLPLLAAFQKLAVYQRVVMPPGMLRGEAFVSYYQDLIERYLGPEPLFW